MTTKIIIAQLLALRSGLLAHVDQIDATLTVLGVDVALLTGVERDSADDECRHPREAIEDRSTLADDGACFVCTLCGHEQSHPFY